MLSVSNLLTGHTSGNERLRYGHTRAATTHGNGQGHAAAPAEGPPRPVVAWAITKRCNLKCVHCYASATADAAPGELTTDEALRLLDDLRGYGCPAVLVSGGEPLCRPDAFTLLQHAHAIGLPTTLSTNGTLIDDATADRIAAAKVRYVGVSIDGLRPQHDKLRGLAGAFDATLASVHRLRRRGVRVGLRFTIHALNHRHLDDVFDLALSHQIDRLCVYHLAYAGRGEGMQRVDLTPEQTRAAVDRILRRTQQAHDAGTPLEVLTVGNHADAAYVLLHLSKHNPDRLPWAHRMLSGTGGNRSGCHIASIDPVGDVHYDQFSWHYTCGNIRQQPFSELWAHPTDPRLQLLRNRTAHLPPRCQQCQFLGVCNGNLRTRAEAATGNWLGHDPACYLTDEETTAGVAVPA